MTSFPRETLEIHTCRLTVDVEMLVTTRHLNATTAYLLTVKTTNLYLSYPTITPKSYTKGSLLPRSTETHVHINRMPNPRILCVAEKPSIAKAVANHLAGNNVRAVWQLTQLFLCRHMH
jgi:hypothetical protein